MNENIIIKKLTEKDKSGYMQLFSDVLIHDFPEYSTNTKNFIVKKQSTDFDHDVVDTYKILLGAYVEDKLVGFANTMHLDQGVSCCAWLMVDRSYQKKGIGKKLIEQTENEVRKRGDHSLNLYASEWNIPFYKKLGYDLVGLYKKAWFGADYYLFVKLLQEPSEENFLR